MDENCPNRCLDVPDSDDRRQAYSCPRLIVYGTLEELTAGGFTGTAETGFDSA